LTVVNYEDRYKNPWILDEQNGTDIFTPKDAVEIDYIYEQILYRNRLILENDGETFQIWRKPTSGTVCDNPSCPASQDENQAPKASCPRCLGTGYIGGYQYQGEALIRVAPSGMQFQITPNGMMKVMNPRTWTMPEPVILSHDILIAVDRDRLTEDKRVVDYELQRRTDNDVDGIKFDSLPDDGILRIEKISDEANSDKDYNEQIDYNLSNNGVLWTSFGDAPDALDSYFVTYLVSKSLYRRFEVKESTRSTWRGVILHQELDIIELDINHPAYENITAESFDNTRQQYPFPVSDWFGRE
jgi:hypothetical protein